MDGEHHWLWLVLLLAAVILALLCGVILGGCRSGIPEMPATGLPVIGPEQPEKKAASVAARELVYGKEPKP